MGIFDAIRGQFVDVIEWTDQGGNVMAHKYDMRGKEIMMGAQLTVRESQAAIFVNEGQIADVYLPGRYELSTQNMPVMTALQSWKFGFNSPFKADVYFVNTRQFLDRKWGTANPVMMRDPELGVIRVRAFGAYAFKVANPEVFLREVFGSAALTTTEGVEGQLKRSLVSGLSDAIAESHIPALDLAANYAELAELVKQAMTPKMTALGLQLTDFVIENISLPEEVEKTLDRRTSMGVMGDLHRYTQYQAAEALRDAAKNPSGGIASAGVGLGAGAAIGSAFAQAMQANQQPHDQTGFCSACGAKLPSDAKFCPSCGKKIGAPVCPSCGEPVQPGAKFCQECGGKLN